MTYTKFKLNFSEKTNKKGNNLQKLMKSERRKLEKITLHENSLYLRMSTKKPRSFVRANVPR